MGGLPHVLAAGLLAAGLSSCSLLDLLRGTTPFDPNESFPPFPFPTATAIYSTGNATIDMSGEPVVLDRLVPGASEDAEYGTHVVWTNGAGWYLSYSSVDGIGVPGTMSYITLDRIVDNQHWVIGDPFRCVATTTASGQAGLAGTAVCRGLSWTDWFSSQVSGLPQPIPGQSPFDAEITFEAH